MPRLLETAEEIALVMTAPHGASEKDPQRRQIVDFVCHNCDGTPLWLEELHRGTELFCTGVILAEGAAQSRHQVGPSAGTFEAVTFTSSDDQ